MGTRLEPEQRTRDGLVSIIVTDWLQCFMLPHRSVASRYAWQPYGHELLNTVLAMVTLYVGPTAQIKSGWRSKTKGAAPMTLFVVLGPHTASTETSSK